MALSELDDYAEHLISPTLSTLPGVAQINVARPEALRGARARAPRRARRAQHQPGRARQSPRRGQRQHAGGHPRRRPPDAHASRPTGNCTSAADFAPSSWPRAQRQPGAPRDVADVEDSVESVKTAPASTACPRSRSHPAPAGRQHGGRHRRDQAGAAGDLRADAQVGRPPDPARPLDLDPRRDARRQDHARRHGAARGPRDLPVPAPPSCHHHPGALAADLAHRRARPVRALGLHDRQRLAARHHARRGPGGRRRHRHAREHRAPRRGRHGRRSRRRCAGSREIGFTIVSISVSLVAVFIPIFFMPGRDRAASSTSSRSSSPWRSWCRRSCRSRWYRCSPAASSRHERTRRPGPRWTAWFEHGFQWMLRWYAFCLDWCLAHRCTVLMVAVGTFAATIAVRDPDAEGLLPDRGHRPDLGQRRGGRGHLVPGDGAACCSAWTAWCARTRTSQTVNLQRRRGRAPTTGACS